MFFIHLLHLENLLAAISIPSLFYLSTLFNQGKTDAFKIVKISLLLLENLNEETMN